MGIKMRYTVIVSGVGGVFPFVNGLGLDGDNIYKYVAAVVSVNGCNRHYFADKPWWAARSSGLRLSSEPFHSYSNPYVLTFVSARLLWLMRSLCSLSACYLVTSQEELLRT